MKRASQRHSDAKSPTNQFSEKLLNSLKCKVWSIEIRVLVSLVLWTIPVNDCFAFSYLNAFENWLLETVESQ